MKPKSSLRAFLLASIALLGSPVAHADTYIWTQNVVGSQDWTVAGNWNAVADVGIGAGVFVSSSANGLMLFPDATTTWQLAAGTQTIESVPAALSMNTLTLNGRGPNNTNGCFLVIGDNTSTWTIGDGATSTITQNAAAGGGTNVVGGITFDRFLDYTIAPNLTLNQANTTFTGNGGGVRGLVFTGDIGEAAAGYGITKSGSHLLILDGNSTYTGTTTVSGGTLRLGSATALPGGIGVSGGTSALTLSGGVVDLASGDFLRNLGTGSDQFQITGGTSGFSARGGPRVVTVNNDADQELVWGSAEFNPSTLALNTSTAIAPNGLASFDLTLTNKIDLNGSTRTIQVNGNSAILPGVIRDATESAAGLTKTGVGTLVLSGANTYTGPTTISGGTVSVAAANNLGDAASNLVFNNGTLRITGTSLTSISGIGHTVSLTATKTVGFDIDNAANTFTADQVLNQTTGGLIKSGAGTLVLNQANTFTGATTVSGGGTLVLDYTTQDNSKLSATTALTLSGGNLTLKGGTFTQSVLSTTLTNLTGSFITRSSGTAKIHLNAISRGSYSVLSVAGEGIATTDTLNDATLGILGAWATVGSNWAVNGTNAADGPMTAYTSTDAYQSSSSTSVNYYLQGDGTGGSSVGTLRIANSADDQVLDLGTATLNVASFTNSKGGILYAGGSNNNYTITGTTGKLTPANGNGQALLINAYTGILTVDAKLSWGSSGLVKTGEGTLVLGGTNGFSGGTYVYQGALLVNADSSAMIGALNVAANSTLGGTGTIGGNTTIDHGGKLEFDLGTAPGSHNKLDITTGKSLTFAGASTLTISSSGGATTGLYTLVTADGGISGSAPATVNLPVGWTADAPQIVGNDLRINITSTGGGGGDPYDIWANGGGTFDQDDNGDGVKNGLAWLLGAADPNVSALDNLPTVTESAGGLILNFTCLNDASNGDAVLTLQHSSDLGIDDAWTPVAVPESSGGPFSGVTFAVGVNGLDADFNDVTATISSTESAAGKLFGRLQAEKP